LRQFGEEASEQLEYIPDSFKVIRHVRPKFACNGCERVIEAPAHRVRSNVALQDRGCWPTCWFLSSEIICRSIASRRSTLARELRCSAPRWPAGSAEQAIVERAYDIINGNQIVQINQIVGVPSWAKSEPYDVEAKVDADTAEAWKNLTNVERWKQEQPMLQSLLADRCKLKVHFETKELPVYDLVIARGGLKMNEATPDEKFMERATEGKLTGRSRRASA
jgi:hypothetical protein